MKDRPGVSPCKDLTVCFIISVVMMIDYCSIMFQLLEENIVSFVKNELKKFQRVLRPDYPECLGRQREDEEVFDGEDEEQRGSSREAFLKITLHFLRRMKQEELANCLQSSKRILTDLT